MLSPLKFLKSFFIFVVRFINYEYRNKSRHHIKNWSPITLLNTIYKLVASGCIAIRFFQIIHPYRTGFISNRLLGWVFFVGFRST